MSKQMKASDHRIGGDFHERNTFQCHDINWKSALRGEMLSWFGPTEFDIEEWSSCDFSIRQLESEPKGLKKVWAFADL